MRTELEPRPGHPRWPTTNGHAEPPRPLARLFLHLLERSSNALRGRSARSRRDAWLAELLRQTRAEAQGARQASTDCAHTLEALSAEVAALRERVGTLELHAVSTDRPAQRAARVLVRTQPVRRPRGSTGEPARDDTLWVPFFGVSVALIAILAIVALGTVSPSAARSATARPASLAAAPAETADPAPPDADTAEPISLAILRDSAAPLADTDPTPEPPTEASASPSPAPPAPRSTVESGGPGARLRAEPSTQAAVLEVLHDGAQVGELESEIRVGGRSWRQVEAPGGKVGWIDRELLRSVAQPPPAPGERSTQPR